MSLEEKIEIAKKSVFELALFEPMIDVRDRTVLLPTSFSNGSLTRDSLGVVSASNGFAHRNIKFGSKISLRIEWSDIKEWPKSRDEYGIFSIYLKKDEFYCVVHSKEFTTTEKGKETHLFLYKLNTCKDKKRTILKVPKRTLKTKGYSYVPHELIDEDLITTMLEKKPIIKEESSLENSDAKQKYFF